MIDNNVNKYAVTMFLQKVKTQYPNMIIYLDKIANILESLQKILTMGSGTIITIHILSILEIIYSNTSYNRQELIDMLFAGTKIEYDYYKELSKLFNSMDYPINISNICNDEMFPVIVAHIIVQSCT